ncbi:MAG: hypothetical protein KDB97_03830 [Flavobacteriales bacterium]|nr:hypothetical protein [Flavobacteriales bacterium]
MFVRPIIILLCALVLVLTLALAVLWTGSRGKRMRAVLSESRDLKDLNLRLQREKRERDQQISALKVDLGTVQRQLSDEEKKNEDLMRLVKAQGAQLEVLRIALNKQEAQIDGLKDRIVKLEAERGKWDDFNRPDA